MKYDTMTKTDVMLSLPKNSKKISYLYTNTRKELERTILPKVHRKGKSAKIIEETTNCNIFNFCIQYK